MNPQTKAIEITPAMAQQWLSQNNTQNRRMYEAKANQYALDMKRGHWIFTHQGICFDEDNVLIDGQHRLYAIVLSGATIKMLVTKGMPKEVEVGNNGTAETYRTQLVIDGGKPRSVGDQITLNFGIKNGNLVAATVRVLIEICTSRSSFAMSPAATKDIYDIYKTEIEETITVAKYIPGLRHASVFGAIAFAAKPFKKEALEFAMGYFTGENLSRGNPILVFRNYMLNRTPKEKQGTGTSRRQVYLHALNCLKYHVLQEPLKMMKLSNQGIDFFSSKQKKAVSDVAELMRL